MLGTDELTARAFIVVKHEKQDQKVTAISKIKLQDSYRSGIDFRILSKDIGFPTIKVDDDVSSWKPGKLLMILLTDLCYTCITPIDSAVK